MQLRITEKSVIDPGYRAAYTPGRDETVSSPRLAEKRRGERVNVKTRAVKRAGLSEADLVRLMQRSGAGRPSTYAATLEALRRHGYIEARDGRLFVTGRGRQALAFLEENYPFLLDPGFSARIETALDEIAAGRTSYAGVLSSFLKTLKGEKEQDV